MAATCCLDAQAAFREQHNARVINRSGREDENEAWHTRQLGLPATRSSSKESTRAFSLGSSLPYDV